MYTINKMHMRSKKIYNVVGIITQKNKRFRVHEAIIFLFLFNNFLKDSRCVCMFKN